MRRKLKFDVVVIGGGAAGISAAIGAKKSGKSVILIERNSCLGGQATNSNISCYCGFYTCGDNPKQIIGGVGQLVLDKLASMGKYNGYQLSTMGNAIIPLDLESLKVAFDDLILENKITLLLYCNLIDVKIKDSSIVSIECVDDVGKIIVEGKMFVDASGDGNLAYLSKAETIFGSSNGNIQMATNVMKIGNFDSNIQLGPKVIKKAIEQAKRDGFKGISKDSGIIFKTDNGNFAILPSIKIDSLDCETLTYSEINTRKQAQNYIKIFRKYIKGMENCILLNTGPKIGIRETRHIVGKDILKGEDILNAKKSLKSIARGAWPCEYHKDENSIAEYLWIKNNDYYDIPIEVLMSKNIKNLWSAGRTISADSIAYASVRVMGISFATGHAAGVGAAYMCTNEEINIELIRKELKRQGALI